MLRRAVAAFLAHMTWIRRPRLLPLLLATAAIALAGCGGDDGDSGSNGANGANADPAETILADAGLEVCSEDQEQIAQSTVGTDFEAVRSFAVAADCAGSEASPNTIRVFQFGTLEGVDAGAASVETAYPRGTVMVSGALVIVVTGPDREANAEAVAKAYEDSTGAPVRTV
jgi:hypothetical protein